MKTTINQPVLGVICFRRQFFSRVPLAPGKHGKTGKVLIQILTK